MRRLMYASMLRVNVAWQSTQRGIIGQSSASGKAACQATRRRCEARVPPPQPCFGGSGTGPGVRSRASLVATLAWPPLRPRGMDDERGVVARNGTRAANRSK